MTRPLSMAAIPRGSIHGCSARGNDVDRCTDNPPSVVSSSTTAFVAAMRAPMRRRVSPGPIHVNARNRHRANLAHAWVLSVLSLLLGAAVSAAEPGRIIDINPHLLAFYIGRDPTIPRYASDWNWLDDGAIKLGIATYAVYQGEDALVYDSFTSVAQARWVRDTLAARGVRRYTLALSHWHPDHVGGNALYAGDTIVASAATRALLVERHDALQSGTAFGPPAIPGLVLPNLTFPDRLTLYVGNIEVQLRHVEIHSADSVVALLPQDGILLAGDTLEDTVTLIAEPGRLPEHLRNLRALREFGFTRIYPNHGSPDRIAGGGYGKTLIDATIEYLARMLARAHEQGGADDRLESYLGDGLAKGWITLYEPYRDTHRDNLDAVRTYYRDRPLPAP
jgi:glyoxylase-like metal-dependent hydrolase (beta-lactamase superfamily II)